MPKKTTRTTQQRSKEDQWRRRVAAQTRASTPTLSNTAVDDVADEMEAEGYTQADMRQLRSVTTSAASATATRSTASASAPSSTSAANAAAQRRAAAASRAARSRLAINTLSIDEEMHYVRSDVRSLVILTAICVAVIIVLAFIIR